MSYPDGRIDTATPEPHEHKCQECGRRFVCCFACVASLDLGEEESGLSCDRCASASASKRPTDPAPASVAGNLEPWP